MHRPTPIDFPPALAPFARASYKTLIPHDLLEPLTSLGANAATIVRSAAYRLIGYIDKGVEWLLTAHASVVDFLQPIIDFRNNAEKFIDEWVLPAFDLSGTLQRFVDSAFDTSGSSDGVFNFGEVRPACHRPASLPLRSALLTYPCSNTSPLPHYLR